MGAIREVTLLGDSYANCSLLRFSYFFFAPFNLDDVCCLPYCQL